MRSSAVGERTAFRRGSVGRDTRGLPGAVQPKTSLISGSPTLAHDVPLIVEPFAVEGTGRSELIPDEREHADHVE